MLYFAISVIINIIVWFFIFKHKNIGGILEIDRTDDEKDRYQFIVNDLSNIDKYKRITLKIKIRE